MQFALSHSVTQRGVGAEGEGRFWDMCGQVRGIRNYWALLSHLLLPSAGTEVWLDVWR